MSGPTVTFEIPYPPSVNHYWAHRAVAPRGRKPFVQTYLTERAETYKIDVQAAILERFGILKPLAGRLAVRFLVHPPDLRVRDLSNTLKGMEDALTSARVWCDDSQIDALFLQRGAVKAGGLVVVTIERLAPPAPEQSLLKLEAF